MAELPGDYIAGFVDGEGCFALKFIRSIRHERRNKPIYFYWDIEFAIGLRADDIEILKSIKDTLECGKISITKSGQARFSVETLEDLECKVVPFFERYPLRAKKKHDFLLWKEALAILKQNRQKRILGEKGFRRIEWTPTDTNRLIEIAEAMREYKSERNDWKWLKEASMDKVT